MHHIGARAGALALVRSQNLGLPIRVARGANPDSEYAPATGYRYDGLYRVDEHWQEEGKSGFTIWVQLFVYAC